MQRRRLCSEQLRELLAPAPALNSFSQKVTTTAWERKGTRQRGIERDTDSARVCVREWDRVERERDVHEGYFLNVILHTAIFRTKMSDNTRKSIWIKKSSVNPKSTSNQSSKACRVLQYPSRKVLQYPSRKVLQYPSRQVLQYASRQVIIHTHDARYRVSLLHICA